MRDSAARVACAIGGLAFAAVIATGVYWDRQLAPMMEDKAVRQMPAVLIPKSNVPQRQIDLGFAVFAVPSDVPGEPVRHDDTLFVTLSNEDQSGLIICPPMSESEAGALLASAAPLIDPPPQSYFELRKLALETKPFSVWSVPLRGVSRTRRDLVLLLMKSHQGKDVKIFENDDIGLTVATIGKLIDVRLSDKRSGVHQAFLIPPGLTDPVALASTLIQSYRFKSSARDAAVWGEALAATGIRVRVNPAATDATVGAAEALADDEARMRLIAEEVRRRRAERGSP